MSEGCDLFCQSMMPVLVKLNNNWSADPGGHTTFATIMELQIQRLGVVFVFVFVCTVQWSNRLSSGVILQLVLPFKYYWEYPQDTDNSSENQITAQRKRKKKKRATLLYMT
jgi:nicotinamide riboside transporter PnuC